MKYIKNILIALAIIISVLWIEVVHADMSGPELREFEVVVINPDGVDYYDYNGTVKGHLNKDDVVLVMYEYNGKYTLGKKETASYGEYSKSIGDVNSLEGFSIVQEEVDPTKLTDDNTITKYDEPQKAKVVNTDGVDVYAGPSSIYKRVGHIDNGTILTYKYSTEGTHIYVEYNGFKGWAEILKGKILVQNDTQYIFSKDVVTECGTVPKNSITTPIFKTDRWTHKAVFEYNNCEFMHNTLKDEEVFGIYPYNRIPKIDVSLYEYADTSSTVLTTIPANTEITTLAASDYFYDENVIIYAEYNGIKGWIIEDINNISFSVSSDPEEEVKVEDTIKIEDIELPTKEPTGGSVEMPRSTFPLKVFILLCILGVSVLAVTAVVIIILVNRSKKNNIEQK